jgi:hypothetical protein
MFYRPEGEPELILRLRKMTWTILLWSAAMLAWIISVGAQAGDQASDYCANRAHRAFIGVESCESAAQAGSGLAIGVILAIWFCGFIVLSLIWLMTRPREQVVVHVEGAS